MRDFLVHYCNGSKHVKDTIKAASYRMALTRIRQASRHAIIYKVVDVTNMDAAEREALSNDPWAKV